VATTTRVVDDIDLQRAGRKTIGRDALERRRRLVTRIIIIPLIVINGTRRTAIVNDQINSESSRMRIESLDPRKGLSVYPWLRSNMRSRTASRADLTLFISLRDIETFLSFQIFVPRKKLFMEEKWDDCTEYPAQSGRGNDRSFQIKLCVRFHGCSIMPYTTIGHDYSNLNVPWVAYEAFEDSFNETTSTNDFFQRFTRGEMKDDDEWYIIVVETERERERERLILNIYSCIRDTIFG